MKQHKKHRSILTDHEKEILEALTKRTPLYIIAKKHGVHTHSIRYWLRQHNRIKEVLNLIRKRVPEDDPIYMDITMAMDKAKEKGMVTTRATMIRWVEENRLGFQPGGSNSPWFVDKKKFQDFIEMKTPGGN